MAKKIDYNSLANNDVNESFSPLNVHDHLKELTKDELRAFCDADRLPFGVCILNVTGELNVGTIIRNALLTGAKKVGIIGRRKYDKRGTVGSYNYLDVDRVEGLMDDGLTIDPSVFWSWIDKNKFFPIFIEQGGMILNDTSWKDVIYNETPLLPCLVFGNENRGIPDNILNDVRGQIVSIEQLGTIRSYNVGSASAIVMHSMVSGMGWWT